MKLVERRRRSRKKVFIGMRGLQALMFRMFDGALPGLPTLPEVIKEVKASYPMSRFMADPSNHFKYYKSKYKAYKRRRI